MAFTLTYSDGQETDYDDDTAWEVDDGVLKMGRRDGEWSVYVSPSHWAVLEVGGRRQEDAKEGSDDAKDEDDEDADSEQKSEDESDEKDQPRRD
ncbi:hypothetical protein [Mycobacterium sp. NPDC006124]|uniref:hypothetical protein n=1 Tax=Mycobacterium sp. NPDC006124 TaxID=3156729 RepID=UPI0033AD12CF